MNPFGATLLGLSGSIIGASLMALASIYFVDVKQTVVVVQPATTVIEETSVVETVADPAPVPTPKPKPKLVKETNFSTRQKSVGQ